MWAVLTRTARAIRPLSVPTSLAFPARWSELLRVWCPPLLLIALPILLFLPGLRSGAPPFGGDVLVLNYPLLTLIKRQLGEGMFPLWNNYAAGGYPLTPFSSLIVYPPLWSLRFLSVDAAITLLDIVHFALAGLGAYLLAGITGASRVGRLIGALAFSLSGYLIGHLFAGHLFEIGVIGWTPWVYYAAHRVVDRRTVGAAVFLGCVAGMQVLADGLGFLVFTIYPVAVILLIGLVRAGTSRWQDGLRVLGLLVLSGAVAGGLAAALALPFDQVLKYSIRAGGLDFTGASKISLPPAALLMLLSPDAVGNELQNSYWLNDVAQGYWHEFALYVGLLPLLATLAACLYCRTRTWARFYVGLTVVGLLLAFGRYTPIYGLAFHLPLVNLVRVPSRWLLVSTLGVAVLSACGVDWLLAQRSGAAALLRALRVPLIGTLALAAVLVIALQVLYMQGGHMGVQPRFSQTLEPAAQRFALFACLLVLILACHADRLIRPRVTALLLVAVTLLDLWVVDSGWIRFTDPGPYYRSSTLSDLLQASDSNYRVLTVLGRGVPNRFGMVSGDLYDAEDFAPVTLYAYWAVTHPQAFGGAYDISNADERDTITCYDPRFASLMGISEVTFSAPFSSQRLCAPNPGPIHLQFRTAVSTEYWMLPNGKDWNPTPFWDVSYVYRNPDALPRSFLLPLAAAHTVAVPPSRQYQERDTVMQPGFDGRRDLILDAATSHAPLGLTWLQDAWARFLRPVPVAMPSLRPGETRVLADTSNSVQVVYNAPRPSYLVLDDAYYPGWQAWIDGKPATIRKADYLLRAVQVPAGAHRVTFTYAPLSYLVGMLITLGAFAAVICFGIWSLWRRRRTA